MREQNMTPNDPNTPTAPNTPRQGGDPTNPQWGGQTGANAGTGGTLDPSTGTPAPDEGPGAQGTRTARPGGDNDQQHDQGQQWDDQNDVLTASQDSFPASDSPSYNPGRP